MYNILVNKNDEIELNISDLGVNGQGIGRLNSHVVFVNGALPGETVRAQIIALKKNYLVARLLEIVEKSPMRVKAPCPVFMKCGGCTLQHLSYAAQLEFKQKRVKDCMERIAGLDVPVLFPLPSPSEYRYRNKAAFPVQIRDDGLSIGFYALHSHRIVDVNDCKVQHADIAVALNQLRVWIIKYGVSVYDEQRHSGLLRHIVFRTASNGEIMMVLVINGDDIPHRGELIKLFKLVLPQLRSIVLNKNMRDTNVIMGDENTVVEGRDHFYESIGGLKYRIGPSTFLQVNSEQTGRLYNNVFRLLGLKKEDSVADLYCGAGTISLAAAQRAKRVFGVEESAEAVDNARFNAALNGIENASFYCGDVADVLPRICEENKLDAVIVDPPRKGLAPGVIDGIIAANPRVVAYVSCDPATMARDMKVFAEAGYAAREVQPVDMFPQTPHVECLTVLTKGNG